MNQHVAFAESVRSSRAYFTAAEFARMAAAGTFDDMKVELVNGELERVNLPKSRHSMRQTKVVIALNEAIVGTTLVASAEVGIDLGKDTVRGCDAAILRAIPDENRWLNPLELLLVVEVAETTINRDLGFKRVDYARGNIPHYWVVDGDRSIVYVHTDPVDGEYTSVHTVKFGEPLPVPGTDRTIVID